MEVVVMASQQSHLNRARLDKFILAFNLPPALKEARRKSPGFTSDDLDSEDSIQVSVYGVVVPKVSVPAIEATYAGQTGKASSFNRPSYEDVSVNFNIDNRFRNYNTIWEWINLLNDSENTTYDASNLFGSSDRGKIIAKNISAQDIEYKKEYTANMSLYGVDEYNKNVVQFTFTEAFPVTLGEINYNYQTPDEIISSFTYTFSQLHFKRLAVN